MILLLCQIVQDIGWMNILSSNIHSRDVSETKWLIEWEWWSWSNSWLVFECPMILLWRYRNRSWDSLIVANYFRLRWPRLWSGRCMWSGWSWSNSWLVFECPTILLWRYRLWSRMCSGRCMWLGMGCDREMWPRRKISMIRLFTCIFPVYCMTVKNVPWWHWVTWKITLPDEI